MKKLLFSLLLIPASLWAFQQPGKPVPPKPGGNTINVIFQVYGAPASAGDTLYLYELWGMGNKVLSKGIRRASDNAYELTVPASAPKFYGIGYSSSTLAKVILGNEPNLTFYGQYDFMEKSRCAKSPVNEGYFNMKKRAEAFRQESDNLRTEFFATPDIANTAQGKVVIGKIAQLAKTKKAYLDSLKAVNPLLWRSATLLVLPEFLHEQPNRPNALDFYGNNYFQNADLKDAAYAETPELYTAHEEFVKFLMSFSPPAEMMKKYLDAQIARFTPGTRQHRMALGGIVNGLKSSGHPQVPFYAKMYLEQYKASNLGEAASLEYELRRTSTFTPGMEAPDLVGPTPDGQNLALSQLRGKVVLIDFWASWCGPCRREMPNVKANYEKYKAKGFDIFGVSLDRDMEAWKKAIEADAIPWHHISDLKGWKSSHAQLYSVSSIPQTVLIDRDGKIIARNLRGEQLGDKLKEIFGF